jgi:hypothetical protein
MSQTHNHEREVRKIRIARDRFDDLFEVALSSDLPEVRALAHLMKQANIDMWFDLCDLYRESLRDENPMVGISRGIEAALEGGDFLPRRVV